MHQYKIIYTEYTQEGAPTNISHHVYADSAEAANVKYNELNGIYRTEGGVVYKAYKVRLQVAAYKNIDDPAGFFAQFEV